MFRKALQTTRLVCCKRYGPLASQHADLYWNRQSSPDNCMLCLKDTSRAINHAVLKHKHTSMNTQALTVKPSLTGKPSVLVCRRPTHVAPKLLVTSVTSPFHSHRLFLHGKQTVPFLQALKSCSAQAASLIQHRGTAS